MKNKGEESKELERMGNIRESRNKAFVPEDGGIICFRTSARDPQNYFSSTSRWFLLDLLFDSED
jgi:hypothetical protein